MNVLHNVVFISRKCGVWASLFFFFTRHISRWFRCVAFPEHELLHAQGAVGKRHGEVVRVRRGVQDRFVVRPGGRTVSCPFVGEHQIYGARQARGLSNAITIKTADRYRYARKDEG